MAAPRCAFARSHRARCLRGAAIAKRTGIESRDRRPGKPCDWRDPGPRYSIALMDVSTGQLYAAFLLNGLCFAVVHVHLRRSVQHGVPEPAHVLPEPPLTQRSFTGQPGGESFELARNGSTPVLEGSIADRPFYLEAHSGAGEVVAPHDRLHSCLLRVPRAVVHRAHPPQTRRDEIDAVGDDGTVRVPGYARALERHAVHPAGAAALLQGAVPRPRNVKRGIGQIIDATLGEKLVRRLLRARQARRRVL